MAIDVTQVRKLMEDVYGTQCNCESIERRLSKIVPLGILQPPCCARCCCCHWIKLIEEAEKWA